MALQTLKTKGQLTFLISFCAKHVNTVSSLSLMLKTCQLVNILGGMVVYELVKTIMYWWVLSELNTLAYPKDARNWHLFDN